MKSLNNIVSIVSWNAVHRLFFAPRETAIKWILEDTRRFSWQALFIVGCVYFLGMLLAYGTAVPAGVFIPTIMVGACWGGLFGLGLQAIADKHDPLCNSKNTYASAIEDDLPGSW